MIFKNETENLKEEFEGYVGKQVVIKENSTKTKSCELQGVIKGIHSNLFVIRESNKQGSKSYSYKDILTKQIEVKLFDGNEFNPIEVNEAISLKER